MNTHKLKRTKISYPCRVCVRECTLEQESIQCDGCQSWLHQDCVHMSLTQYIEYSDKAYLQYYCWRCSCDANGRYNFLASLSRIAACAPDVSRMREQAESETKLLCLYNVSLPVLSMPSSAGVTVDRPSVMLLQEHSPWILQHFVPAAVGSDGNCLFRSVSLALYGHEGLCDQLRLLAAIEVLLYPSLYDDCSADYYAPFAADDRLVLSRYADFVVELAKNGSYSDMLTVLVISSVIQKPIQTRWPVAVSNTLASPMTKLVAGRCVETTNPVNIMWSTTEKCENANINHFVPLIALPSVNSVSDVVDKTCTESPSPRHADADGSSDTDENSCNSADRQPGHELQGHFLSNSECVQCIVDDVYEPVYDTVPTGVKENIMYKVKMHTGRDGHKFWDDCGAWEGTHGKKTYHLHDDLTEVRLLPDGLYGSRKRVEGKITVVAMNPQPQKVIILHRLYSKLKRQNSYQRRVTYMEGLDCFVVEYLGQFPEGVEPHGNAKKGSEYVRTQPRVLTEIKTAVQAEKKKPKRTYEDMKTTTDADIDRPRDRKQVNTSMSPYIKMTTVFLGS